MIHTCPTSKCRKLNRSGGSSCSDREERRDGSFGTAVAERNRSGGAKVVNDSQRTAVAEVVNHSQRTAFHFLDTAALKMTEDKEASADTFQFVLLLKGTYTTNAACHFLDVVKHCRAFLSDPAYALVMGRIAGTCKRARAQIEAPALRLCLENYFDQQQVILDELEAEHNQRQSDREQGFEWISESD